MSIQIIMPAGAFGANEHDSALDTFLRAFAEKHKENEGDWAEKYGTDFEDEMFMMHCFCWCEKDDCPWCGGEIIPELMKSCGFEKEHETAPNFWYKPLDFKVWWYKYIGRGVEVNKQLTESEFKQMIADSGL